MRKIKILFGINELNTGGGQRLVLLQVQKINRERFETYLTTLMPSATNSFDADAQYLGTHWKRFSFKGIGDLVSWWHLYQYLRTEQFDVVVTNLFFTSVVLRCVAYLAGVPIVLSSELSIYAKRSLFTVFLERILSFGTARILAVSKEVIEYASQQLGLPRNRFALAYSPIDSHALLEKIQKVNAIQLRTQYNIPREHIVIATAGRLITQKGHRYLIEACALLKAKGHTNIKVYIFGEGYLRTELETQIQTSKLSDIVFLPGVGRVEEILALADIFVMPSLWEGFSVALLEGMVAGKPIVATNVSGSSEVITDDVNGFLVPIQDSTALSEALEKLILDPNQWAVFGTVSTERVKAFSIENHLESVYRVIDEERAKRHTVSHVSPR